MTRHIDTDWAAARSDKWRRQLVGLEAMLKPIDERLIDALDLDAPCRIADVGCGGGATTLEVRRRAPAGSVVHGFDVSPALIEVARRRGTQKDHAVAFEIADMGVALPPGLPYDRLVSRLGVMFFADPRSAFANLRRWLTAGGQFAFAVWGPLGDNDWMTATRGAVSEIIDLPAIEPAAPGPFRYEDPAALVSLLEHAGFAELEVADWRQALPIGGGLAAADAAHFALASFSSFSELLSEAGGEALTRARQALTARFAACEQGGRVIMKARVHLVTGTARSRR